MSASVRHLPSVFIIPRKRTVEGVLRLHRRFRTPQIPTIPERLVIAAR
jgi:hypothetical protein